MRFELMIAPKLLRTIGLFSMMAACAGCAVPATISGDHVFSSTSEQGVILFTTSTNRLCPDYMLLFSSDVSNLDQRGVFSAAKTNSTNEAEAVYLQAFVVDPKLWGINGFMPSSRHERHSFRTNYFAPVAAGETVYAGSIDLDFREDCRTARIQVKDKYEADIPKFLDQYENLGATKVERRIFGSSENTKCSDGFLGTRCFP